MSRSRPFSIFLLKEEQDATNSLKDDHGLDLDTTAAHLPDGATLYVFDAPPRPPWWRSYLGIKKNLRQTGKAALMFLPVSGRTFVFSFGRVSHHLREESYEYDFGIRVTLNCVDPAQLRNTDALEPGAARRQRTQVSIASDLTYFDFDRDSKILKSLTGKAKPEHQDLVRHATGANNLRINSKVSPDGLSKLCERLLALYQDDAYKTDFPEIQNISPIRDPSLLTKLNSKLLDAFRSQDGDLFLAIPALVEYQDNVFARFSGFGPSLVYDDVFIDRYYEYLDSRGCIVAKLDLNDLRRHKLLMTNEEGEPTNRFSVFKSLVFDTSLDDDEDAYHLVDGSWYRVAPTYLAKLQKYLDPRCIGLDLPAYNNANEGEYNEATADDSSTWICLDKTSISPSGQSAVEPCDLYTSADGHAVLCHVKVSTFSARLSHLFNQGTNSLELLRSEAESREKLRALVEHRAAEDALEQLVGPLDQSNFKVVFAIVTHKDPADKSGNFPLFSRVSLMRCMKALQRMGVPAGYGFVPDHSLKSAGKPKPKKLHAS